MGKRLLIMWLLTISIFVFIDAASSPSADDLVKMARSGVDEEVLTSYIDSSPDTFALDADDIITLKDLGVPSKVISEALRHGRVYESDSTYETAANQATNDSGAANSQPQEITTSAAVAPPPGDQNISFFYQAMYPYGNWLDIDGEWCWQPNATIINTDWAPYCSNGHWVYSDWGWCWVSDYSWGWAPFHYGRWFHHRSHGWCWMPGVEWGPAWVTWRWGDDFCGWAPLPPRARYVDREGFYFGASLVGGDFDFNLTAGDFFFVPANRFCDPHPWAYRVPSVRREEVFRRSAMVRNSYGFEHDHFINRGIEIDRINRVSNRPVARVTVAAEELRPGQEIHRGMIRENRLVIYKPAIARSAPKNPAVIRSLMESQRKNIPQNNEARDRELLQRRESAARQTLQTRQFEAGRAQQEQRRLERAARNEADSKKRSVLTSEAEIQALKARQAQEHVANIKQWNPREERRPAVIPQSRVTQQPPVSEPQRQRVERQVRTQVHNEARVEQQRQQVQEQMLRDHPRQERTAPPPAARNNQGGSRKDRNRR
jgi:hypothetical protein